MMNTLTTRDWPCRRAVGPLVLGLLLPAAAALAQAEDPMVVFAANIEKCKAHLAVSAEPYANGDRAAALHASHPIQEIGNKVIGPAARTSPEATLDDAAKRVVPEECRSSLAFRARVLADLLSGMATEYDEAYKAGKITQMVEYQDAYAFFKRAQAAHRHLTPALRTKNPAMAGELDGQFAALAKALPGLTPPALPIPAAHMQGAGWPARRIPHPVRPHAPRELPGGPAGEGRQPRGLQQGGDASRALTAAASRRGEPATPPWDPAGRRPPRAGRS